MAFHEAVLQEIVAGRVPRLFRTTDLKKKPGSQPGYFVVGNKEYSENAINTIPRNHSVRPDGTAPGDYVRKGRRPAFIWHGNGLCELNTDLIRYVPNEEADDDTSVSTTIGERPDRLEFQVDKLFLRQIGGQSRNDPAVLIVRYLAEPSHQSYFRRRPHGDHLVGWGQRLRAYFWPDPTCTWDVNCLRVSALSNTVNDLLHAINDSPQDRRSADTLLKTFEQICNWGGVTVPETDSSQLARESVVARRCLLEGKRPPRHCRLNSAWTKLYAFAIPHKCVIHDSRVAAALLFILDPVMPTVMTWPKWKEYRGLGKVDGRGGSRPRVLQWKWPYGYGSWESQEAANGLCCAIAAELNRSTDIGCRKINDPDPWRLREVEAVLFMEGY